MILGLMLREERRIQGMDGFYRIRGEGGDSKVFSVDGKGDFIPFSVDLEFPSFHSGVGEGIQLGTIKDREIFQEIDGVNTNWGKRAISAGKFGKLKNQGHLIFVKCINPVVEVAIFGDRRRYIYTKSMSQFPSERSSKQRAQNFSSPFSGWDIGVRVMASREGARERTGEAEKEGVESSGGGLAPVAGL